MQYLHAGRVSAHYFDVLGLRPALGRNFSEDEDRPHGPKTAILSYSLWRAAFDANPDVVGQAMLLKSEPYTIIGVLPEDASTPLNADVYISLQPTRDGEGSGTNFQAIMRLRDTATWQQADAELNRAWSRTRRVLNFLKAPGAQITYYFVPLQKGQTEYATASCPRSDVGCGIHSADRVCQPRRSYAGAHVPPHGEIATRIGLGASRWQVQRQLWIENLLLALVGGTAGIGVGFLALRWLLLLLPEHFLPGRERASRCPRP